MMFLLGALCGAVICVPVGGLLGYWLAACVVAADALGE
jgi:hypothetical protein